VKEHQDVYPIRMMCRLLHVSQSGFYAFCRRSPSKRQREDAVLKAALRRAHARSRGTYGSPRLRRELSDAGFQVGRNRIQRLMRELGIYGVHRRRPKSLTKRDASHPAAKNVLAQDFAAKRPNEKWVADITYVKTEQGWLYLAVVLDLFSKRVVGWSMDTHLRTSLVESALSMALADRTNTGPLGIGGSREAPGGTAESPNARGLRRFKTGFSAGHSPSRRLRSPVANRAEPGAPVTIRTAAWFEADRHAGCFHRGTCRNPL